MELMETISDTEADDILIPIPPPIKKARQGNQGNRSVYSVMDFNELVNVPKEDFSVHQQLLVTTVADNRNMVIKLSVCIARCRVLILIAFSGRTAVITPAQVAAGCSGCKPGSMPG